MYRSSRKSIYCTVGEATRRDREDHETSRVTVWLAVHDLIRTGFERPFELFQRSTSKNRCTNGEPVKCQVSRVKKKLGRSSRGHSPVCTCTVQNKFVWCFLSKRSSALTMQHLPLSPPRLPPFLVICLYDACSILDRQNSNQPRIDGLPSNLLYCIVLHCAI
jgi:hypothetical protein